MNEHYLRLLKIIIEANKNKNTQIGKTIEMTEIAPNIWEKKKD